MKKGLFTKMILAYSIIISIGFIITATILSFWFQGYYNDQKKNELISQGQYIQDVALEYLNQKVPMDIVEARLKKLGGYSKSDILLITNYGLVEAVSDDKYKKFEGNQIVTTDLVELRKGEKHIIESKEYKDIFKESSHIFIIPMYKEEYFEGAIMMSTPLKYMKEPLDKVYSIIWLSAFIAITGSFFILYYFSQKIIIKPLLEINNAVGKISQGEVGKRIVIHSTDEIGELAKAFNSMADSLEQVDRNRQRFISNVSHELRSPITSIRGFIGGILDGVIPKEKENYYLSITNDEIQRLTRLVNDLLDLTAIESGQLSLYQNVIDINEVIRLCITKFGIQVDSKRVNVDVLFEGNSLQVFADRDRIIQVLTNLIDNAIKYVSEGGRIKITTKTKGAKAYISVFNDGPTISAEDLKHIWDRFYKADKSRTSKSSTGLGLPIVRSILSQHGEDIWVENKEGDGVNFIFTLKRT
ncbi:MAG: HAMP domain-containing histidine kinase [Clostridiaceae bacterium]|nr:HAMP domain-containing histidine kinase [Clostridiaceae bacterium]